MGCGVRAKSRSRIAQQIKFVRAYLYDIGERVDTAENYPYEVRYRVMFEHLADLSIRQPETKPWVDEMQSLDTCLRTFFVQGEFVWDARLEDIYPRNTFWYLYGLPRPLE